MKIKIDNQLIIGKYELAPHCENDLIVITKVPLLIQSYTQSSDIIV